MAKLTTQFGPEGHTSRQRLPVKRPAAHDLCMATVLDQFSRWLLGYAMSEHHNAAFARDSLTMAAATRDHIDGVIFRPLTYRLRTTEGRGQRGPKPHNRVFDDFWGLTC